MALSYKARKRLSLLVLLVGMPVYVVLAVTVMNALPRLPMWAEVPVYLVLGFAWILPLKSIFKGIGQPDPDANTDQK
jgi:Na+/citrate or Na+/malate symporter